MEVKKEIVKKKELSIKQSLSDNDFIVLVSEFYESLKPLQKSFLKGKGRHESRAISVFI